ncbi:LysM peptidoglycan-binding domain-containing protein [Bhargavaea ullalensis]|uniref:LysM repeat protein n=1 Tax=Bhargavaea ullalensis TaxID=1265685 RepID=A0ABV2GAW4_9BACL
MKKIAFSVLTTSALAVIIATPGEAEAASDSYAVQSGDSLWKIASKHQISIAQLKTLNNLSTDVIYPGQKLTISLPAEAATAAGHSKAQEVAMASPPKTAVSDSFVYTVKGGDSLSKIASIHKTTVTKLKELNGLSGDLILVGQKLKVAGTPVQQAAKPAAKPVQKPAQKPSASAPSGTYIVQSGDTLSAIGMATGASVDQLMKWNGLTSHIIRVGQKLKVDGSSASAKPESSGNIVQTSKPVTKPKPAPAADTYTIQSGDTLSAIGQKYGVTVTDLMTWNNLSNYNIHVGQKLKVKGGSVSTSKPPQGNQSSAAPPAASASSPVDAAMAVIGTPYLWAGTTPAGFDCSGFIWYAFKTGGADIARTNVEGYFSRSFYVDSPQPGDLVFFNNTYKKGLSHMGIYLGGGKFVHASTSQGVTISHINDAYWKDKFDSFKRFY